MAGNESAKPQSDRPKRAFFKSLLRIKNGAESGLGALIAGGIFSLLLTVCGVVGYLWVSNISLINDSFEKKAAERLRRIDESINAIPNFLSGIKGSVKIQPGGKATVDIPLCNEPDSPLMAAKVDLILGSLAPSGFTSINELHVLITPKGPGVKPTTDGVVTLLNTNQISTVPNLNVSIVKDSLVVKNAEYGKSATLELQLEAVPTYPVEVNLNVHYFVRRFPHQ